MNGDNKVVELQNDLKLKGFEVERTQMVHEETVRNLKEAQLEIEKHQKKIEVCFCKIKKGIWKLFHQSIQSIILFLSVYQYFSE